MTTRGIRNNNPGNIEKGMSWDGLATEDQMNEVQRAEPRFAVFRHSVWGIRAMVKILLTYQRKHKLKTVHEMVSRWAPSHENPTRGYAAFLAGKLGVSVHDEVDLTFETLETMIPAFIRFENGHQPYTWEIQTGIILAGIEPRS